MNRRLTPDESITMIMLQYAPLWDAAYGELTECYRTLRARRDLPVNRMALYDAWEEAGAINRRLYRRYKQAGRAEVYADYVERRADQCGHDITVLRMAFKAAMDKYNIAESKLKADCELTHTLLRIAAHWLHLQRDQTKQRDGYDFTRKLRPIDCGACARYFDKATDAVMVTDKEPGGNCFDNDTNINMAIDVYIKRSVGWEQITADALHAIGQN